MIENAKKNITFGSWKNTTAPTPTPTPKAGAVVTTSAAPPATTSPAPSTVKTGTSQG
jgi:hypothetical protein